jgi:Fe-S cluster assembly protein SufD
LDKGRNGIESMDVSTLKNNPMIDELQQTKIRFSSSCLEDASALLSNTGIPNTRQEAWKYTRLNKLGKINFNQISLDNFELFKDVKVNSSQKVVFVNGYFSSKLSDTNLNDSIEINPFSELDGVKEHDAEDYFSALNTLYLNDGLSIKIKANSVENSIQVIHILTGEHVISNFRLSVEAESNSKSRIALGFFGIDANAAFCNFQNNVSLEENSEVEISMIQHEDESSFHIGKTSGTQNQNSVLTLNSITLGGGLVRNDVNIEVDGENCVTNLNGAYILNGKQHVDNHTVVDHKVPNCESNELYKGVMDDKSTAVFNGKVFVRQNAQKIAAFQSNGNVLLSDGATVNSKPELEIYADDVKCSHGSTTGQLDDEAVFYLQSRGISEANARQLLVNAFIGEVIEYINDEEIKATISEIIEHRFGWKLIH